MELTTTKKKMVNMLEELGFTKAATKLKEMAIQKRKLAIAYEYYRVVRPAHIEAFNERLKKETIQGTRYSETWKTLEFCPIQDYPNVPPDSVLHTMRLAVDHHCFDHFEVASIRDVDDPLLFGRIKGCPDRFFIDQWDSDVSITDILKDNEG